LEKEQVSTYKQTVFVLVQRFGSWK